jgi:hypothetical protein
MCLRVLTLTVAGANVGSAATATATAAAAHHPPRRRRALFFSQPTLSCSCRETAALRVHATNALPALGTRTARRWPSLPDDEPEEHITLLDEDNTDDIMAIMLDKERLQSVIDNISDEEKQEAAKTVRPRCAV